MSQNLPMLARNTLDGLTDEAGALYLRGFERDEGRAFWMACAWQDQIKPMLSVMLPAAIALQPLATERTLDEVLAFVRERHFRRWFPDGRAA